MSHERCVALETFACHILHILRKRRPHFMAETENVLVMPDPLRDFVRKVFMAYDLPEADAAIVADHLVEADMRGVYSHGVIRVEQYTCLLYTSPSPRDGLLSRMPS